MIQILIDACPVKDETYRVSARYKVPVIEINNSPIRIPHDWRLQIYGLSQMPGLSGHRPMRWKFPSR